MTRAKDRLIIAGFEGHRPAAGLLVRHGRRRSAGPAEEVALPATGGSERHASGAGRRSRSPRRRRPRRRSPGRGGCPRLADVRAAGAGGPAAPAAVLCGPRRGPLGPMPLRRAGSSDPARRRGSPAISCIGCFRPCPPCRRAARPEAARGLLDLRGAALPGEAAADGRIGAGAARTTGPGGAVRPRQPRGGRRSPAPIALPSRAEPYPSSARSIGSP